LRLCRAAAFAAFALNHSIAALAGQLDKRRHLVGAQRSKRGLMELTCPLAEEKRKKVATTRGDLKHGPHVPCARVCVRKYRKVYKSFNKFLATARNVCSFIGNPRALAQLSGKFHPCFICGSHFCPKGVSAKPR
jgi:hypothetical protein